MVLNEKEFIEAINDVEESSKYQERLNNFFRKNNVNGYILQPDCTATVLRLLTQICNDTDGWIEYFCLELDYGKKWSQGSVIDSDGKPIKLETPHDLYEYLCKEGDLESANMD